MILNAFLIQELNEFDTHVLSSSIYANHLWFTIKHCLAHFHEFSKFTKNFQFLFNQVNSSKFRIIIYKDKNVPFTRCCRLHWTADIRMNPMSPTFLSLDYLNLKTSSCLSYLEDIFRSLRCCCNFCYIRQNEYRR